MTLDPIREATRIRVGHYLRALLIIHGIVTLAAATVLGVFPSVIPSTVGIAIEFDEFLLSYFLAASELAVAVLSIGAVRLTDRAALKLIIDVFIVFHLATAALEILYLSLTAINPVLVANILVRIIAATLFLIARRTFRPTQR
jgi:hypothetical protein